MKGVNNYIIAARNMRSHCLRSTYSNSDNISNCPIKKVIEHYVNESIVILGAPKKRRSLPEPFPPTDIPLKASATFRELAVPKVLTKDWSVFVDHVLLSAAKPTALSV